MKAKKATKLAMMLKTRNTALAAPCAAASRAFDSVLRFALDSVNYKSRSRNVRFERSVVAGSFPANEKADTRPFGTLMSPALVCDSSVSG